MNKRLLIALIIWIGMSILVHAEPTKFIRTGIIRTGILVGGTHLIGLTIEYHFGDNSLGVNVGSLKFRDISVALQAKRYFTFSEFKPYIGIGLWGVLGWVRFGHLGALNSAVGVDWWEVLEESSLGVEMDISYGLFGGAIGRDEEFRRRFIFMPGIYYKQESE